MNRQILTPRVVTRREQEVQERRDTQRVAMNAERIETENRTFNQSVAASNDHYMTSALEEAIQWTPCPNQIVVNRRTDTFACS